jgi:hypothetical protein
MASLFGQLAQVTSVKLRFRPWLAGILLAASAFAYALWSVECPFCHAGNVDTEGRCRLGSACPNYYFHDDLPEEEENKWTGNPGHYKAITCPWCSHTGKMSRWEIWLD